MKSTGHTLGLRARLKNAREQRGLTQQQVADRIAEIIGKDSMTGASVSRYEKFTQHPPVDVMAAWARAVGLRLVVDLEDPASGANTVLVTDEALPAVESVVQAPPPSWRAIRKAALFLADADDRDRGVFEAQLDALLAARAARTQSA